MITSLVGFLITILIVVTIHEYGHLLMARLCGVRVLRFSVGFGSPFWRWISPRTQIEYALAPIPLGGYVQLHGQSDWPEDAEQEHAPTSDAQDEASASAQHDQTSDTIDSAPEVAVSNDQRLSSVDADSYVAKSVGQRMLIASGGPLFNFLLSAILLAVLAVFGFGLSKPVLNPPAGGVLHSYGVRAGDTIVGVGDSSVRFRRDILTSSLASIVEEGSVDLRILSQSTGEIINLNLSHPEHKDPNQFIENVFIKEVGFLGPPAIVGDIAADFPASNSSLRAHDRIVEIDGVAIGDFNDLVRTVRARANQSLPFTVERDGARHSFLVSTSSIPEDAGIGLLGVRLDVDHPEFLAWRDSLRITPGFFDVFAIAAGELWDLFALTFRSIAWLVTGALGLESLKGPIGIATYAGTSLESGLLPFIHFIALVSVSIGVLNLLPIPVLDGGHILLLAYEGVRGKPPPQQIAAYLTWVGVLFVGTLMAITIFNDIYALL